jgi:calpain-15
LADSDKAALKELGLVTEHSYGIIAAATVVDSNGNQANICKLRNPWGRFEWNGDWGDESDLWTEELKEQLEVTIENDGCFWMDIEDMKQYFDRVQICKVEDNFTFSSVECKKQEVAVFRIEIQ